jgi:DNA polymerase-3 subunit gamma/tau
MFENIIGQTQTVQALRAELALARFPRSALFFGPAYAGKLSTALEAARVLTCAEGTGEWSCECASCRMQKELTHPQTVLLGPRYADVEIAASADALMRSRKPATLYLLLRAVRKLTRRFDPWIADAEDARVKGMQERVAQLEELAGGLSPGIELPPARELGELLERIAAAAAPVAAQVRSDTISIGQVRRLAAWAHLTAAGSRKIAIIENSDRMQDSARNALLKLLEEPPAFVHLILLTTRRAAIIPTILSRLRPYSFPARTAEEEKDVMTKIFRRDAGGVIRGDAGGVISGDAGGVIRGDAGGFSGLRGFFLAWREINPEKLSQLARRFMELVRGPRDPGVDIVEEMSELLPERRPQRGRSSRETIASFLEELMTHLGELLREGSASPESLERWSAAARDAHARIDSYNMQPAAVVEALFYSLRGEGAG